MEIPKICHYSNLIYSALTLAIFFLFIIMNFQLRIASDKVIKGKSELNLKFQMFNQLNYLTLCPWCYKFIYDKLITCPLFLQCKEGLTIFKRNANRMPTYVRHPSYQLVDVISLFLLLALYGAKINTLKELFVWLSKGYIYIYIYIYIT